MKKIHLCWTLTQHCNLLCSSSVLKLTPALTISYCNRILLEQLQINVNIKGIILRYLAHTDLCVQVVVSVAVAEWEKCSSGLGFFGYWFCNYKTENKNCYYSTVQHIKHTLNTYVLQTILPTISNK